MSLGAFVLVRTWESERVEREFDWRVRSRVEALRTTLRGYEESLYALRDLYDSSEDVTAEEFHRTGEDLRGRHPGIQSLMWLPRVSHAARADFESRTRLEVDPRYEIKQATGPEPADLTPAEPREEYLPIQYVDPLPGHAAILGFDYFRGPHQRAIGRALEVGGSAATRRVPLREPSSEEFGWVLFLAVFEGGGVPATAAERSAKLRGFVGSAQRLSELAGASFGRSEPDALDIVLADETPGGTEPYLINFSGGQSHAEPPPAPEEIVRGLHRREKVDSAGRDWILYARPSASWLGRQATVYPYAFLAFGIGLTALLASGFRNAGRRAETVERLVAQRTAELAETHVRMRADIERRRQAEERYRAFLEHTTEAIWRFELDEPMRLDLPEDEQIEHFYRHAFMAECNDACARMYGYDRAKELIGTRLGELLPRDDPANEQHLRAFIQSRFQLADAESHELTRDGQPRIFLNNLVGIIERGFLTRSWGTQRDITTQRRVELQRRENETRLRVALAAANLGTWEWDRATNTMAWSDELFPMLGVRPGGVVQTYEEFIALVHPDDRERVQAQISKALGDGAEFEVEYRVASPDGPPRWIFSRGDVRRGPRGEITGLLGAALDITARKAAEEERALMERKLLETQKLESLGVLAGGIAHDFNNLLAGILGNASLAKLDIPPASPLQHYLNQIELASQRAADLCKQMLAYSGKGHFVVQRVDLSALVEDTVPLLHVSIQKGTDLKFNLSRDLPAVSGDVTQLRQILMNLVINGADAIGEQGGVIEVTTGVMHADRAYLGATYLAPALPEGDFVFLEIRDTGCGMDAETRDRIFDPFFTTKFTGRGLGLAAVLGIVRGHSGALKIESEPGRGTTFRLLLPKSAGPSASVPVPDPPAPDWRGSGTVLVVDDEATVRNVTARMLRTIGFDVIEVPNGREAVAALEADRDGFAAVLLDLTMPGLDGGQTFAELHRINPNLRVLLMSGFNEQDAVDRFAGRGLGGFLQKPFKPNALRAKLRTMLDGSAG